MSTQVFDSSARRWRRSKSPRTERQSRLPVSIDHVANHFGGDRRKHRVLSLASRDSVTSVLMLLTLVKTSFWQKKILDYLY